MKSGGTRSGRGGNDRCIALFIKSGGILLRCVKFFSGALFFRWWRRHWITTQKNSIKNSAIQVWSARCCVEEQNLFITFFDWSDPRKRPLAGGYGDSMLKKIKEIFYALSPYKSRSRRWVTDNSVAQGESFFLVRENYVFGFFLHLPLTACGNWRIRSSVQKKIKDVWNDAGKVSLT